jgi:Tol biopolymer transport system component/DNA-binding winged helix-turn-helix (wHTH) protein
MAENSSITYTFGPFRIETQSQRLYRDSTLIPLTRKRFEILLFLVKNAGQVVKKEDIFATIWPNQMVEDSNLTQQIYLLRRDIEDDPRVPFYIQTIPGEGYRFHPQVTVTGPSEGSLKNDTPDQSSQVESSPSESGSGSESNARPTPLTMSSIQAVGSVFSTIIRTTWGRLLLLAMIVLATILILISYYRSRLEDNKQAVPQITPIQTAPGLKSELAYSNNGKFLAYIADAGNSRIPDIFVMVGNGGTPVQITNTTAGEYFLTWSPDNLNLAFLRWSPNQPAKYKLITVPALGGTEREIADVDGGISWSPDGRYFAVCDSLAPTSPTGIVLLSVDGTTRQPLAIPDDSSIIDTRPRFSPDGTSVAFIRWSHSGSGDLHVVDIASRKLKRLTFDNVPITDLQWTDDGEQIIFASNRSGNRRLWQVSSNGGSPILLNKTPADIQHFSISPATPNRLVYTLSNIDTTTEIVSLEAGSAGGNSALPRRTCRIDSSRADDSARWSRDGEQIALCSSRSGFTEIWIARSDCSELRQLTSLKRLEVGSPRWSPDAKEIVFDQVVDGQAEVMKVDVRSGEVVQMTANPASDKLPSYSSDGRWIYFNSNRSGTSQIWKMRTDGAGSMQVTVDGGFEPLESSDGKTLYYTKNNFLWKKDLLTGLESLISLLSSFPVHRYWDIGVDKIYYVPATILGGNTVFSLDPGTGQSRQLFVMGGVPHRHRPGISVTPAGDRIAMSYVSYPYLDILLIENWR